MAIACDEIYLVDDGNSAVSLPEVPLLGVLPGTGGLTRLVDKRKVRRDRADVFSTLAEGLKGKRAKEWGVIDDSFATSKFQEAIDLVELGCAFPVRTAQELKDAFAPLFHYETNRLVVQDLSLEYVHQKAGATARIMQWLAVNE